MSKTDEVRELFTTKSTHSQSDVDRILAIVQELEEEIIVSDQLLESRNAVVNKLPCRDHGRGCIPGAIEQLEQKDELLQRAKDLLQFSKDYLQQQYQDNGYVVHESVNWLADYDKQKG